MPLKSIILLKHSAGTSRIGLTTEESRQEFEGHKARYLQAARERKNRQTSISPLKLWKPVFIDLELILEVKVEKRYHHQETLVFAQRDKGRF